MREYRFRFLFPKGHPMSRQKVLPYAEINPREPYLEFTVYADSFELARGIANLQYRKWKEQNGY